MIIEKASYEIIDELDKTDILKKIERIGKVCYDSKDKILDDSADGFVRNLIERKHLTPIEHFSFTVIFQTSRAIADELARHRLMSPMMRSTRYCDYSGSKYNGEITVIRPYYIEPDTEEYAVWYKSCHYAEMQYMRLRELGFTPEKARGVLPLDIKTEFVLTGNLRNWRHVLQLRAADYTGPAHPAMHELMIPLLMELRTKLPAIFEDIVVP